MQTMKVNFPLGTTREQAEERLNAVGKHKLHHFYPEHQVGANTTAMAVIEVDNATSPDFTAMSGVRVDSILNTGAAPKMCENNCGCR